MRPSVWKPNLFSVSTFRSGFASSTGIRSNGGFSMKSMSPDCSAFTAVCASAMVIHSTRSTFTTLPPAVQLAGSLRGT